MEIGSRKETYRKMEEKLTDKVERREEAGTQTWKGEEHRKNGETERVRGTDRKVGKNW